MTGAMTPFSGRSGNTPLAGQRMQCGIATVDITTGAAWAETPITFDEPFSTTPAVVACVAGGSIAHFAIVGSLNATSFRARAVHRDGSSPANNAVLISWVAIGV